jgi:hypothetical protein
MVKSEGRGGGRGERGERGLKQDRKTRRDTLPFFESSLAVEMRLVASPST